MIKAAAHKILNHFGLQVRRLPQATDPIAPFEVFEYCLKALLNERGSDFYFVQVGANDGIMNDKLRPLILKYGLRGCLVEPMPDVYAQLQKNYIHQSQLSFQNVMIGRTRSEATIHRFARSAPVPADFYHGLARSDEAYIKKRAKEQGLTEYVEAIQCEMITFRDLMLRLQIPKLDMLYIDTEGNDDTVINSAFEAGISPSLINYEWTEMSVVRRRDLKLLLLDNGYRFIDVDADTICVKI